LIFLPLFGHGNHRAKIGPAALQGFLDLFPIANRLIGNRNPGLFRQNFEQFHSKSIRFAGLGVEETAGRHIAHDNGDEFLAFLIGRFRAAYSEKKRKEKKRQNTVKRLGSVHG
jgi:hypothetical protein